MAVQAAQLIGTVDIQNVDESVAQLQSVGAAADEAQTQLTTLGAGAGEALMSSLSGVDEALSGLSEQADAATTALASLGGDTAGLSELSAATSNLGLSLDTIPSIVSAGDEAILATIPSVAGLGSALSETAGVASGAASALTEVASAGEGAGGGLSGLQSVVGGVMDALVSLGGAASDASGTVMSALGGIGDALAGLGGMAGDAVSGVTGAIGDFVGGIGDAIGNLGMLYFQIQGVIGIVQGLGDVLLGPNASMEQLSVAFNTLMGNTQAAQTELQSLYTFAAETPFQFPDIAKAAESMLAVGINAKLVQPDIKAIGDTLSALGENSASQLEQVSQVFDKISTGGKLTAVSMMELSRHMIPAWKLMSEGSGLTIQKLQEMTKKGTIPATEALDWLRKGMEKSFGTGMINQAQTFTGLLSTLKDNAEMAWRAFTGPIFDAAKRGLQNLLGLVSSKGFQDWAKNAGASVAKAFGEIGTVLGHVGQVLGPVIGAFKTFDWKSVGAALGNVKDAFLHMVGPLGQIHTPLQSIFQTLSHIDWKQLGQTLGKDVTTGLRNLAPLLGAVATGMHNFTPVVQTVASFIKDHLIPAFGQVGNYLKTTFMPVWKQLQSSFQQIGDALRPLMPQIKAMIQMLGVAVVAFIGFIGGLLTALANFISGVAKIITGVIQTLSGYEQVLQGIATFIVDLFSGNFSKLSDDLSTTMEGIKGMFKGIWNIISGIFQATIGTVVGFVKGFSDTVVGIIQNLSNTLVGHSIIPDMVNAIISWFAQLPARALSAVQSLASSLGGFFSNLAGQALTWGSHLVQNIASGITSAIGSVVNAASSVANAIASVLHHTKPEIGPLKDDDLWGQHLGENLVKGLQAIRPKVAQASLDLASTIAVLAPRSSVGLTSPSVTVQMPQGAGQPIILTLDGRQVAKGLMPYQVQAIRQSAGVRHM